MTQQPGGGWCRRNEEYIADFELIMRRTLTADEQKLFRYYYLLGADSRLCCRKLGLDKGAFFHIVYRIQHKLGQAFRETEPFSLYPVDEYFVSVLRDRTSPTVVQMPKPKPAPAGKPPLKRVA